MYGKGLVSSTELNRHKSIAQGKEPAGDVQKLPTGNSNGPTDTGRGELNDGARASGPAVGGGSHGQQAAPDHGSTGRDHFRRGGLL